MNESVRSEKSDGVKEKSGREDGHASDESSEGEWKADLSPETAEEVFKGREGTKLQAKWKCRRHTLLDGNTSLL